MVEELRKELSERMYFTEMTPETIGRVMHEEMGITTDVIRHCIFPFDNGGFMTPRMMLRIILKKDKERFDRMVRQNAGKAISFDMLEKAYVSMLSENVTGFSENEIWWLSTEELFADYEFGELSSLIGHTDYTICAGSFAFEAGSGDPLGVCVSPNGLAPCVLKFLKFTSKTALERVVRVCLIRLEEREMTASNPVYRSDRISAVRPPAGEWGIKIEGNGGKNGKKNRFCGSGL